MIRKVFLIIFALVVAAVPQNIFASEFATAYDVLYEVEESGITTVTEKITLRNLTSEYYANQFKLTISATQLFDILASDGSGVLDISQEKQDFSTILSVKFNSQVVGLGKTLPLTLTFKSNDFAQILGKVWEVRVPKISSDAKVESYNLTIAVPESFGVPALISPIPKSQTSSLNKTFLTFDKEQLQSAGVFANFGTHQLFDFRLTYHLQNSSLVPILTKIALPPDTAFQDVIYQTIEPKPLNVTVDQDGNYLAWFRLNRNQKLDVRVFGSAKLYTNSKVRNPNLSDTLRKKYTESDKFWEKDHPQILAKMNEILGLNPPETAVDKARLIFQFVVNHLKYDPSKLKEENIERLGAVTALYNPESVLSMEFTDLFIALSRAAGIPARELNGYAYTANTDLRPLSLRKDYLHAWPEYWDSERGWIMVDPTWANTTGGVDYFNQLDLNHFVFAVKGSSQPIPAGSYYIGKDSYDVVVSLSDIDFLGKPQIDVFIETPSSILSGFPAAATIKITNTGNAIFPSTPLIVSANKLAVIDPANQQLGVIPAFGLSQFDFNIRTKSLFDSYKDQIVVLVGGQKFTKDITVEPFILFQTAPFVIAVILALMVVAYLVVLGTHIYQKKK